MNVKFLSKQVLIVLLTGIFAQVLMLRLQAAEISLNMSEVSLVDSSNLVSNFQLGRLLPPLQVQGWDEDFLGDTKTRDISVGDGSHGPFNVSTYQKFGSIQGQTIIIDTDQYATGLQVTEFRLDAGWILRPVGSLGLLIQSLGDVIVDGLIDCSGSDGSELSTANSASPSGGVGRCGGGNGGAGGSSSVLPQSGAAINLELSGGSGGPMANVSQGQGGGGGGAFGKWAAFGGRDSADSDNGTGGTGLVDTGFAFFGGGAGGGGGGYFVEFGLSDSSGGGGGAGGGSVMINATGRIEINGEIWAHGGRGGGNSTGLKGGGGGGGGGGSIAIFGASDVVLTSLVKAQRGIGGLTQYAFGGGASGNGGTGGQGRVWVVSGTSNLGATGSTFESPATANIKKGQVNYVLSTSLSLVTKVIDFWNSAPTIANIEATTGGSGESTIEIASSDYADFDPTGSWQPITQVINQAHQRYMRVKVTIDNSCLDCDRSPRYVEALKINYTNFQQENFEFEGGCGLIAQSNPSPGIGRILLWLLLAMVPLVFSNLIFSYMKKTSVII